jgi:glycerate 2-kinase
MRIKNFEELVSNGGTDDFQKKRKDALEILTAAVDGVDPYRVVSSVFQNNQVVLGSTKIDLSCYDHVYCVGFGKASAPMAHAVCEAIPVSRGVIITNDPAKLSYPAVEVVRGGHPLPDEGSLKGTEKILHLLEHCSDHDCVIIVISGGGSSLLCKPLIPLDDLRMTTLLLQHAGADINELNIVRTHLSQVKGGKLASHTKASVISLVVSDVIGDPLSVIASGPTSPDPSTFIDAKTVLMQRNLWERVPESVRMTIEQGIAGVIPETHKEGDTIFNKVYTAVIVNNQLACDHAVKKAQDLGYETVLLSTTVTGEASEVGRMLVSKAKHFHPKDHLAFISGGETTVTVRGNGTGGRNQEMILGCVKDLAGTPHVFASMGTDGIDGNSDAAGAIADGRTLSRAKDHRLDPPLFLRNNDTAMFFRGLHDAIITGPTGTNVMDIQVILL